MQPIDMRLTAPPQAGVPQGGSPQAAARTAASPRPAAAPPPGKTSEPSEIELEQAIEAANTALRKISSDLEFVRDSATGKTVMRIIDAGTRQVIHQFPSEEMLAIARALDRLQGLLIQEEA